ncbi:MAG: DNA oxidative demethylase AlkB [Burkholderiales bacterium]|nr:DNA oxidative demethylase AlkB [Burkholderiales bacterium]
MNFSLFDDHASDTVWTEDLCPGAVVLRNFIKPKSEEILATLERIAAAAPFRQMTTPGGYQMSVAMTCCGDLGWVSDRRGYRYDGYDPETGLRWPALPALFLTLAQQAAAAAGYADFIPDSCLINRYLPGTKLSLHQDKDECDYAAPIVSVSLGIPASFLFGGPRRQDRVRRILLTHGDVVVWGGPARLYYHGIAVIKSDAHPLLGPQRINLTFRKAG